MSAAATWQEGMREMTQDIHTELREAARAVRRTEREAARAEARAHDEVWIGHVDAHRRAAERARRRLAKARHEARACGLSESTIRSEVAS